MSEPRGNTDSDQEMQDLSEEENEQTEEEVEEEEEEEEEDEKPSVVGDDLEAKDPEMNEEGDLWNNGVGVVEVKEEANVADNVVGDAKMVSESDEGTETPDSVEPEAVEMKLNGGDVEKTGEEESKPVKEHLENGNKSEETKEKEVKDDEENQSDESLKKEEKAGTEDTEREEGTEHSPKYDPFLEGEGDGTEEEQAAFMRELENFHKEKCLEFKPPKFYGEGLNCLKLWRAVTRLGGYDQVTSCKLWRQVGESFKPPKTCTTISWSFRCFYEKALLEYEKHKVRTGELRVPASPFPERMAADNQTGNQASGSGRARRDAAARAMQGWHSQRLLGNGEVGDPIIKDKNSVSLFKRDKHPKNFGTLKRKKPSSLDHAAKVDRTKVKTQVEAMVVDVEQPADWVKINVKRTKDCFEVYALVPGLLREEVHVQSDPAGRLIISGEPEHLDNPWGVTPFKKVVTLPSRIDPHQTSAVVTLHGQLFVRAPFEQSDL